MMEQKRPFNIHAGSDIQAVDMPQPREQPYGHKVQLWPARPVPLQDWKQQRDTCCSPVHYTMISGSRSGKKRPHC
ncbi:hypothetical protein DPMN_164537 [Dreissena polymorpha]|uniref:Uncharacterized protein n=1 Tax=Dreissena polymorpha TaxID=45954 RepID=A0A9D4ETV2_DREPO|nr:hypothetical protein DPMN_164537 [Dreissena polymorpha]